MAKKNITQMIDYAPGVFGWRDPYPFRNKDVPSCDTDYNPVCGIRDTPNGEPYCGIPIPDDIKIMTGIGTSSFLVGPYENYYANTGQPQNNPCDSISYIGYKRAYAKKAFHGRYGFNSPGAKTPTSIDLSYGNIQCAELKPILSPDTVKYLSIDSVVSKTVTQKNYHKETTYSGYYICPDGQGNDWPTDNYCREYILDTTTSETNTAHVSTTVDRYSGNLTVNAYSSGSTMSGIEWYYPEDQQISELYRANEALLMAGECDDPEYTILKRVIYYLNNNQPAYNMVFSGAGSSWTVEWHETIGYDIGCPTVHYEDDRVRYKLVISLPSTLDFYVSDVTKKCRNSCDSEQCKPGWGLISHDHYEWTGTTYTHTLDTYPEVGSSWQNDTETHISVVTTLSNPYSTSDLQTDLTNLLANLPLDRDDLLPWRQDGNTTKGPVCYYDEHENSPIITGIPDNSSTGDTYGIPGPSGLDHVWDPAHPNYCICTYIDSNQQEQKTIYEKNYGAYNDSIGGGSATAWLNDYEASSVPDSAFVGNGFFWSLLATGNSGNPTQFTTGLMWACKTAEVIFKKPSINFARPCGIDRFQIDNTKVLNISNISGSRVELEPTGPYVQGITTNTLVWLCAPLYEGCYKVNKVDNYNINLVSCVVSGSNLPDKPIVECGTGIIAPLKWQTLKPAICGRVEVGYIDCINNYIKPSQPTYLVTGDAVTITGAVGGNINGVWSVIVNDNQNITLVDCVMTNDYKANTGQLYSSNGADWKWNDTESKGEFVSIDWHFNYRGVGEYNRTLEQQRQFNNLGICTNPEVATLPAATNCGDRTMTSVTVKNNCVSFNPCGASIAFYSPNGEWANVSSSVNLGWGGATFDPDYSSMWQGNIRQAIDDPFWQRPPQPPEAVWNANTGGTQFITQGAWVEDNGNCLTDTDNTKYYPMPPQVEARTVVPIGAPALPSGITLFTDTCTVPFNNSQDMFYGNECNTYSVNPYATPWIDYLSQRACVCNDGIWANDYMKSGVNCGDMQYLPAP
jgi:hypothetical protein